MMKNSLIFIVILMSSVTVHAAQNLSTQCEQALALSALPKGLRANASAYTYSENGFEKTLTRGGPFTCIVERNHPGSIVPQCLDEEGTNVIVPAIIHKSNLALKGMKPSDIRTDFEERVKRGEYEAPASIGVNYMTSHYNYIYIQGTDRMVRVPPHLMHYAPNVTDEQVGAKAGDQRKGLPHINQQGVHGYYISFVEHASDKADVERVCKGQLPDVFSS
jgi:hypothetical protein